MSGETRAAIPGAAPDKSPERIAGMFDAIAPRYDLLNRLLSGGIDRWWRRRAIDSLALTGREVLVDVATGTADVALEARAPRRGRARAARIVGVDFARAMLALGVGKVAAAGESKNIVLVHGDAMRLPVASRSADAVTIAFGIRNVQTAGFACAEMARVLRPGGRLAILEFGVPRIPGLSGLYQWYFKAVLPRVGRMISGHTGAYSYLPASVGTFTPPGEFARMLEAAGFKDVRADPLTIGIVYLYTARRPSPPS